MSTRSHKFGRQQQGGPVDSDDEYGGFSYYGEGAYGGSSNSSYAQENESDEDEYDYENSDEDTEENEDSDQSQEAGQDKIK